MFKTFLRIRAHSAQMRRAAQPVAILRMQAGVPNLRRQFRILFTTKQMEASAKWLR